MHLPTLRQLQFLCALADEKSFSRAADVCNVTQPTLSSAIKEVEAILGVQLVEREARGASLTRAGEETVERARAILSSAADLVSAAHQAGAPLTGPFHLGAIPTLAPYLLPRTLSALRSGHPELKLYLREDQTDRLIEGLRNRTLDAALIALPWASSGIETETLGDDEFLFIAPKGHKLSRSKKLSPEDLNGEDVLLLEDGHCLRDHAIAACALSPSASPSNISATSLATLVQMVAGGLGISLVPKIAAEAGLGAGADLNVRQFDQPLIGRQIGIAWRAGSPREAEARMIGKSVKKTLAARA
ncbi:MULTISPECIES: hydrogen peroxide-inducible genes activator [Henriciella]|jgi:LysR family hydrogen peroxide-inducible transcriptional activator|uniref:LysR family transcriptional regulator n=1 Tax=Henriciella pelagia TaxID=1977912 RepID=A0ABQ1JJP4_9PROT|nr:hydrogen peroxide-inducible genes activator [Henriciella pelagia]GGB68879.1 LysR family transcriptional regulator [Henriciella pelagia]